MDDKTKAKLSMKLSGDKKFDKNYTRKNREWFCRAVVNAVAAKTPDSGVEAEAARVITQANARVAADRDFAVGLTLTSDQSMVERSQTTTRVETIYGVIARNPELAETAFDSQRRFLVRRRYRGVIRMTMYVNPNEQGYMRYPGECGLPPTFARPAWRVNVDAKDLWERITADFKPLRVRVPAGTTPDPAKAVATLWGKIYPACDGNLFDCAHAVCCVLLDTLFEASNADKLLKSMYSRGPNHLAIVNPTLFPDSHFLWESPAAATKVFSKEQVLPEDLQIGDHVYLWNHGLYPRLFPLGLWSGEHALVTLCGDRSFSSGTGFLFSGHGMDPSTVNELRDRLLKDLHTGVHRIHSAAKFFLNFRRTGNASIPLSKWTQELFKVRLSDGSDADVIGYVFDVPFSYGVYDKPPRRDQKVSMTTEAGLIVYEIPSKQWIAIATPFVETLDEQRALGGLDKMTLLARTADPPAGGSPYDPPLWQIPFINSDVGAVDSHPVFGGPKGSLKLLDVKDMPKFKFGRRNPSDKGADVTRPTADTSSAYVSFLRTSGAIS